MKFTHNDPLINIIAMITRENRFLNFQSNCASHAYIKY